MQCINTTVRDKYILRVQQVRRTIEEKNKIEVEKLLFKICGF